MKKEILEPKQYKKKGSPLFIQITPAKGMNDKDDPDWFIDVITYSNKTKVKKSSSTITKNDLETWLKSYIRDGWEETEYIDILLQTTETNK